MAPPRRRSGCRSCGCLLLGVLLVLAVWTAFVPLRLLERAGLREHPAERLLSAAPDLDASQAMLDDLQAAGADTRGISIYVFPVPASADSLAIAVLDESQGFGFQALSGNESFVNYLALLGAAGTVQESGIKQMAVLYRDIDGQHVMTLVGATQDCLAFAEGRLTRDEFLDTLHANFDLQKLLGEVSQ